MSTRPVSTDQPTADCIPVYEWRSDRQYFAESKLSLHSLSKWQYRGKVGLTTSKLHEQASLNWEFHDQGNAIQLFGPLGVGAVKIEFDQYGVQLIDNKGRVHRGHSAQALLTDIVGWPIPIDALSQWLFVLPAPGSTFQYRLNESRQVASIRQLGWQIDYADYRQYADRLLPRKLTAFKQFEASEQGAVTVKLVTRSWQW